jgi:hypothetical protein
VKPANFVNKKPFCVPWLEKALKEKLQELLGHVPWLQSSIKKHQFGGFCFQLTIPLPNGETGDMWIQCKADPRPSQFPQSFVATEEKRTPSLVFAAPHISSKMAKVCRENDWSWFDLAGNCVLDFPGAFYIERNGLPPVHPIPRPVANLSTPEAARVIRALLVPDHSGQRWTQAEMRLHCEPRVSIGLVNKVVRHLCNETFTEEIPDGGFRLRDPLGLLTAWRDLYRFERHQRRSYFTLLHGRRLQEAMASLSSITGGHAAYAAFSAADFQAPNVRQPKTWVFVGSEYEAEFRAAVEAKPVTSGENITLLTPDDDGVFYGQEAEGDRLAATNPVQTYVDLYHCGGRGQEAAEALLEQNLKPAWKTRGFSL